MKKCNWLFVSGLGMQEHDLYRNGIFKLVPRWDKCNNVLGDYVEK
jgi:hypothetical protein